MQGLGNYYEDDSRDGTLGGTFVGKMLLFMLDTLVENRNRPLDDEDVAYFAGVRGVVESDWLKHKRIFELDEKLNESEASDAEVKELRDFEASGGGPAWEELLKRAERCIANWCIANAGLVDRQGRPVEDRGIREVKTIFEPPPVPVPPCPVCKGKAWLPPRDATQFPEACWCKARQAQAL